MSAPPPGAAWLPAEGPVQGQCDTCHRRNTLEVEHRMVWGVLGAVPATAPEVGDGCPRCGRLGQPKLTSRLVAHLDPPASLAGVMPKVAATDCTWLVCPACSYDAPCHFWVWMVCTAPGCTRESRATVHVEEKPGGGPGPG